MFCVAAGQEQEEENPVENNAPHLSVGKKSLEAKVLEVTSVDQLDQYDKLIERMADEVPEPPKTTRSKTGSPLTLSASIPEAPPPPSENFRSRTKLQQAAELLGVDMAVKVEDVIPEGNPSGDCGPFFGIELADLYVRDGTAVPKVLKEAAVELRKRSHVEGIFRIPGRAQVVSNLVDQADKGTPIDMEKEETAEIASFLKKFFSLLPSSVIPSDLVDRFGETARIGDNRALCNELRQIVDQVLPPERTEVLNFTLSLLHDISLNADKNKMTSKNLATVFLPALFFSVQGDSTSPEEIMKMAVLGKTVSNTLSFMIENPELKPENCDTARSSSFNSGPATIPVNSPSVSRTKGNQTPKKSGSFKERSRSSSTLLKGSRRRSASDAKEAQDRLAPPSPSNGKLSAESVLAAMRKAKDRIVRRAGTFATEGITYTGKRGWLLLAKKKFWFVIINDWLYWFKEEIDVNSSTVLASSLLKYSGNVWMARCNVMSKRQKEVEIIQPTGPNIHLITDTPRDCDEWLFSLVEISIVGFPIPHLAVSKTKNEWVSIDDVSLYASLGEKFLTLSKDEEGKNVVHSIKLESATVAKGKCKNGTAGFVIADGTAEKKYVITTHNIGAAQEWVATIKVAINLAYAAKYDEEALPTKRN